jgi:hypothetical protein
MGKPYEIRVVRGRSYKKCRGPVHREGAWVPVENFQPRTAKRADGSTALRAECRACAYAQRYGIISDHHLHGWVYVSKYMWAIRELEARVGRMEAARRSGMSRSNWYRKLHSKQTKIQRRTAAKILVALRDARLHEPRHRISIQRGAYLRGEKERPARNYHEFYYISGDKDTEVKRNQRRKRAVDEA